MTFRAAPSRRIAVEPSARGEGEGALAGVLEHGAGAELGGLQPGICPFGQVLVTGDAPDQEGGGGDGGEGVGGGGPAGLGHGDLGGARAL
jgi:hypothetical protein